MMKRIKLLLMIFTIPILGVAGSILMQGTFDKTIHDGFNSALTTSLQSVKITQEQFNTYNAKISQMRMPELCESSEFGPLIKDACFKFGLINYIEISSYISAAIGMFMLVAILSAASLCTKNRVLLLALFKPGIYATLVISVVLTILNTCIVISTLYFIFAVYAQRMYIQIFFFIGIGAAIGFYTIIRAIFQVLKEAEASVVGILVSDLEQPRLWNFVREVAAQVGTKPPDNLILGLDPNFFVTEVDAHCVGKKFKGRSMYLSLSLMRIFSVMELKAVIGHEFGHFIGLDTKFSTNFYPIYRGASSAIVGLSSLSYGRGYDVMKVIPLLPVLAVLQLFLSAFMRVETQISRDRELKADEIGASIADRISAASALLKSHAFSDFWPLIQEKNIEMMKASNDFMSNQSVTFQDTAILNVNNVDFKKLDEVATAHPTDTHPSLSERLVHLKMTVDDAQSLAMNLKPENSGIDLVDNLEKLDTQASVLQSYVVANYVGIALPRPD